MRRTRPAKRRQPVVVCSIGSVDPTGGAGLFLDAAIYARIGGVSPVYAVAGITAQNSRDVALVEPVRPRMLVAQLDALRAQTSIDAIRIGLIPSASASGAVARWLRHQRRSSRRPPVVLDPVIAASSGKRLVRPGTVRAMGALLRACDVATPNAAEAAELAGIAVDNVDDACHAASLLSKRYGCAVLVTGGHLRGGTRVTDVLARDGRIERFASTRQRADARGTGCMLAAALAVALARGDDLSPAIRSARRFVRAALVGSRPLGRGRRQFDAAGVGRSAV